ncbi:MAG: hypothetical protein UHD09_05145 [Bifidobacterium sp.]|nr:hypothetical protein [Bifidobacterium sp.]
MDTQDHKATGGASPSPTPPTERTAPAASAAPATATAVDGGAKDTKGAKAASTATGAKGGHDVEMIAAWVAFVAFVVTTALAVCGVMAPLAGDSAKTRVFSWFAPDMYVQLIWVPIYVLAAIWLVRWSSSRHRGRKVGSTPFTVTGLLFIADTLVAVGWVFAWQVQNYPTAITLVLVQALLVGVLFFLGHHRKDHKWWDWAPFSLWGSWLVVETVIEVARACTYYLAKDGPLSDSGQSLATVVVTVVLLGVACVLRFVNHDWLYGLVTIWSVVGIAFRLMTVSKLTAGLILVFATLAAILMYVPWRRYSGGLNDLDARAHGAAPAKGKDTKETKQIQPHTL